jgi:hypothetical protein
MQVIVTADVVEHGQNMLIIQTLIQKEVAVEDVTAANYFIGEGRPLIEIQSRRTAHEMEDLVAFKQGEFSFLGFVVFVPLV